MKVAFRCPRCERTSQASLPADASEIVCDQCESVLSVPEGALDADGVHRCVICHSDDLFVRKDFPQRLGVGIVVAGFILSSIAWYNYQIFLAYGILFTTAAIDIVLYLLVADALVCYRCGAHYRRVANVQQHHGFDLETHERYRQMAARMEQSQDGSTTDG